MNAHLAHELIPLQQLRPGQAAEVMQVLGPPDQVHRLEELGLRRGTGVHMVQDGSPCIVRLADQAFGFRAADLLRVLVLPKRS